MGLTPCPVPYGAVFLFLSYGAVPSILPTSVSSTTSHQSGFRQTTKVDLIREKARERLNCVIAHLEVNEFERSQFPVRSRGGRFFEIRQGFEVAEAGLQQPTFPAAAGLLCDFGAGDFFQQLARRTA